MDFSLYHDACYQPDGILQEEFPPSHIPVIEQKGCEVSVRVCYKEANFVLNRKGVSAMMDRITGAVATSPVPSLNGEVVTNANTRLRYADVGQHPTICSDKEMRKLKGCLGRHQSR